MRRSSGGFNTIGNYNTFVGDVTGGPNTTCSPVLKKFRFLMNGDWATVPPIAWEKDDA